MTVAAFRDTLAALATMSPVQLRAEWRRVLKAAPPSISPDMMRRGIAYRLQERVQGGLPTTASRELDRIAARLAKGLAAASADVRLKPGMRLARSWGGKTHMVAVTEDGFLFENRRFGSLSHVAEAITGAHWSGPRFFGLGRTAKVPQAEKRRPSDSGGAVLDE